MEREICKVSKNFLFFSSSCYLVIFKGCYNNSNPYKSYYSPCNSLNSASSVAIPSSTVTLPINIS